MLKVSTNIYSLYSSCLPIFVNIMLYKYEKMGQLSLSPLILQCYLNAVVNSLFIIEAISLGVSIQPRFTQSCKIPNIALLINISKNIFP